MSLAMPSTPDAFDLSCVTTISVTPIGNDGGDRETGKPPDYRDRCIDVQGLSRFSDVRRAMADRFAMNLPESGLKAIHVRGTVGACTEASRFHEAGFYGGAPAGADTIEIPIVPNLELARKFGESSTGHVCVDVEVDVVVVVEVDGDGGVDLVGRSLTVSSESGRNRGLTVPIGRGCSAFNDLTCINARSNSWC